MTSQTRILVIILCGLLVGGIGYVAFKVVIGPIREHNKNIESLEDQIDEKRSQQLQDVANLRKLQPLLQYSLPANRELAESEYETLLGRLFRDSKITGAKYAKQTQSETDPEPELVAGTPGKQGKKAFVKLIYTINFEKTNMLRLTDFLERYNRVPLLHQIVKCSIKHTSSSGPSSTKPLKAEERNDLSVNLVTEAVLFDGAPDRRTLFPVPVEVWGTALGGVGYHAIQNDTEKTRNLTPKPDPAYYALATVKREYDLLAARDVFHGPLPEYVPEAKKTPTVTPPAPPPFDPSPYIYLNGLVRKTDGEQRSAQAEVNDRYYDQAYTIRFSQIGDLFEVKVKRLTKGVKFDPKTREPIPVLTNDPDHPRTGSIIQFADRGGVEVRSFKIYGLIGNSILLGEKEKVVEPKGDKDAAKGARPGKTGKNPVAPVLKAPDAKMAAVGGMGAAKPPLERFFQWNVGQSLGQLKPLGEKEAKDAIAKATKGLSEGAEDVVSTREEAPLPRLPLN